MRIWFLAVRHSLMMAFALALSACGTSVLNSHRSAALSGHVPSSSLVVIASSLGPGAAVPTLGSAVSVGGLIVSPSVGARLDADALAMGTELVRQLPPVLQGAGLVLPAPPVLATSYPATPDALAALLPADSKGPVLTIKPVSAKTECPNSCFAFMVLVKLLAEDRKTELWVGTFQMPPKASNFADFSGPVNTFVGAMVGQMKKDGLLK